MRKHTYGSIFYGYLNIIFVFFALIVSFLVSGCSLVISSDLGEQTAETDDEEEYWSEVTDGWINFDRTDDRQSYLEKVKYYKENLTIYDYEKEEYGLKLLDEPEDWSVYEVPEEELIYNLTESGYEILYYLGDNSIISIPSEIDGIPVTGLHDFSSEEIFHNDDEKIVNRSGMEKVKMVKLPESITYIGSYFFAYSTLLQSIYMGDNVETIGTGAFSNNYSLCFINLSEKLEIIKEKTFYCCNRIPVLYIPDSVKYIENMAFVDCTRIRQLYISKNTVYHSNAFPYYEKSIQLYDYKMEMIMREKNEG